MNETTRIVHTARTRSSGGRDHGIARSFDGRLDLRTTTQSSDNLGTSPEHLFAAAWSTCLETGIRLAAQHHRVATPAVITIDAEIDLCVGESGSFLSARLFIAIPDFEPALARTLIDEAHANCPYSKATRGNINVTLKLVERLSN